MFDTIFYFIISTSFLIWVSLIFTDKTLRVIFALAQTLLIVLAISVISSVEDKVKTDSIYKYENNIELDDYDKVYVKQYILEQAAKEWDEEQKNN